MLVNLRDIRELVIDEVYYSIEGELKNCDRIESVISDSQAFAITIGENSFLVRGCSSYIRYGEGKGING